MIDWLAICLACPEAFFQHSVESLDALIRLWMVERCLRVIDAEHREELIELS